MRRLAFCSMRPSQEQLLSVITRTEQLVPAPRTLARALHLLRDPQSNLEDIATLISRDSALSVDVLRCANSAYYALSAPVTSIQQAVQVVGVRDTLRILNVVATYQMAHRSLGSYGIAAEDYCNECLYSGLLLEQLAIHTAGHDAAESYTAGLLRLVGRLAVNQAALHVGGVPPWDGRTPLPDWEREQVGITQAEAGALLLAKWGFPDHMVEAVCRQGEPMVSTEIPWLTLAVNFSAHLLPPGLNLAGIQALVTQPAVFPMTHPFVIAQNLDGETLLSLCAKAQQALEAAQRQMGGR